MSETKLSSHPKEFPVDPARPFQVGVAYYRPPVPPPEFWDEDFARISAAGMQIVRTFYLWHWAEPVPEQFEFDDLDLMLDLAAKHDLKVWLDTPVGTHMSCPEWMIEEHPDMRVEWPDGSIQHPTAGVWAPQGSMIHNFDHPKWREYVERFIREIVPRYKDHSGLGIWGTWDGISFAGAWSGGNGYPPYNDYTIEKYRTWLKQRFTLDELNEHLLRRYRSWKDVDAPRHKAAQVEMLLYRQFHHWNMADHLGWLADLIDQLDGAHEQRSHGGPFPRACDEICSARIDSWGLSHHSADRLTSDDPYKMANECIGFQWSRAVGRNGRWWDEEIYSNFVGGLSQRERQTTPEESTIYLWLALIEGAAGALYWEYRPEYMTFEAPGLSLVSLDGEPTGRWKAIEQAIAQINGIAEHLPLQIPPAELALGYSGPSNEIYWMGEWDEQFKADFQGVHQTLWAHSVPRTMVTPVMDWSQYRVVYLPNFAVLDEVAIERIRQILEDEAGPSLLVEGHFGSFAGKGHWSFHPPEGLADLVTVRVVDFDKITQEQIDVGENVLQTEHGPFPLTHPCNYIILEPRGDARAMATLNGEVVGVELPGKRLMWWGLSLAAGFGGVAPPELLLPQLEALGMRSPFSIEGDRLVAFRRFSQVGGSLIFLLNVAGEMGRATVEVDWAIEEVTDLIHNEAVEVSGGVFKVEVPPGCVGVFHAVDE